MSTIDMLQLFTIHLIIITWVWTYSYIFSRVKTTLPDSHQHTLVCHGMVRCTFLLHFLRDSEEEEHMDTSVRYKQILAVYCQLSVLKKINQMSTTSGLPRKVTS